MYEDFEHYLQDRGLSALSIRVYLHAVRLFHFYFPDVGGEELLQFRQRLITSYNVHTANLYIIGLNRYVCYLGREHLRMRVVKVQQHTFIDNVLSTSQYELLKRHFDTEQRRKWYFIVWTLAATGVRVSELVQFRVEHAECGYMDVCSKGNKLRRIFIPSTLQRALLEWCQLEHRVEGYLFENRWHRPISKRGIAKGLESAARRCGIDPRLAHPHAFRHLFAKNFLSHRNDLTLLADLLGHESLETTKIYLRHTMSEQQEIIDQVVRW